MEKLKLLLPAYVIILMYGFPALAATTDARLACTNTANFMKLDQSLNASQSADLAFCVGYVVGTLEAYEASGKQPVKWNGKEKKICAPTDWSAEQGFKITLKWLDENPKYLNISFSDALMISHSIEFPCN